MIDGKKQVCIRTITSIVESGNENMLIAHARLRAEAKRRGLKVLSIEDNVTVNGVESHLHGEEP